MGHAPKFLLENEYYETHEEVAIINRFSQDRKIAIPMMNKLGIKYSSLKKRYGGPLVLASYKAIIMLPYQVSIMKMMENFRYGVATILPSERLFIEMCKKKVYDFPVKHLLNIPGGVSKYIEFYNKEFRDLFIYFDKWEDLPEIIEKTDFESIKIKAKDFMISYEKKQLNLWKQVFGISPPKNVIKNKKPLCNKKVFFNVDI